MKYKHCLEILNISRNIIYGDLGTALELYQLTNLKVLEISGQDPVEEIYGTSNPDQQALSDVQK
jgi:hypothetical protein